MTNKEHISEFYPQWLINNGFFDSFDWKNGILSTFDKFFDFATLHDSYWIGLSNYLDNSVNLIVSLDAFFNQEITSDPGPKVKEWPYLVIKLERVYNIIFESNLDCGTTISDIKTEIISDYQKETLIDSFEKQDIIDHKLVTNLIDSKIARTRIEDIGNGFIEILHDEIIRIQLLDPDGNKIELPNEMKVIKKE